jgi:hypothetical protein
LRVTFEKLQLAHETVEAPAEPPGGDSRGLAIQIGKRSDHRTGARESPLEVGDRDRDVLDPVGERCGRRRRT